jgi:hypothetical protein
MKTVRLMVGVVAVIAAVVAATGIGVGRAYAVPTPTGQRQALVLRVTWPGAAGGSADDLDGVITNSVNPWMRSVSSTIFSGWSVTDPGLLHIVRPTLSPVGACDNTFLAGIHSGAEQAAEEHGINISGWDVIIYWFPFTSCGWSGLGDVLGLRVFLDGTTNQYTLIHELGHHIGLGHGHGLNCRDANNVMVTLSANCTVFEYGDPVTVMGVGIGTYSAIQLTDLGWLNGLVRDVPPAGGGYLVTPLESQAPGTGIHALRIPDGSDTLWVEYRQPVGVDSGSGTSQGIVFVYLQRPDPFTAAGSYLLDLGLTTGQSFGLQVGGSWTNPLGHMKITVDYAEATAAHITVATTLAQVPNVLGFSQSSARTAIAVAGLTVGRITSVNTCLDPGTVQHQSPAGGALVARGTAVSLTVSTCTGGGEPL